MFIKPFVSHILLLLVCCSVNYADETRHLQAIESVGGKVSKVVGGREVSFHLGRRKVSDADLWHVAALGDVVILNLKRTGISSDGLSSISEMKELRKLHLELTQVSDEGLIHLLGLKHLTYLNLYGTSVSDIGLRQLQELDSLTHLYVWQTRVTQKGVDEILTVRPTLKVVLGIDLDLIMIPDPDAPRQRPKTSLAFVAANNVEDVPRSGNGENIEVVFENKSQQTVKLVWIGYDGKPKLYGEIGAGKSRVQNSYENNTWLITDVNNEPLGYFICGAERAIAVIPKR